MSVKSVFLITWAVFAVFFQHELGSLLVGVVMGAIPALLASGAWRLMSRNGRQKQTDGARGTAPLTVTPQADGWTVIDACPAPLPSVFTVLPMLAGFIGAIVVANVGGPWRSLGGMLFGVGFAWVAVGALITVGVRAFHDGRRQLQVAPFAVRAEAVRLPGGAEVASGRIYSLTMRNALDDHVAVVVTNSTIGGLSSAGAAHTAAQLARVAYRVDLDHDGRSSTLAGGLTEPQARAVAAEVLRYMPALS